jgi:cell division protein FtsZ
MPLSAPVMPPPARPVASARPSDGGAAGRSHGDDADRSRADREETARADEQSSSLPIPRPAAGEPAPPTPIGSRSAEQGRRRPVVFEEQEEELDVPDFLK